MSLRFANVNGFHRTRLTCRIHLINRGWRVGPSFPEQALDEPVEPLALKTRSSQATIPSFS